MEKKEEQLKNGQQTPMGALSEALSVSFKLLQILMGLALLIFFLSSIFTVEQYESAIVLRFGKIRGLPAERVLSPGLHWAFPYLVDEVVKVPTGRVHTLQINCFWDRTGREQARSTLKPDIDGYVLTADTNIININLTARYKISDPIAYLEIANPEYVLSCIIESEAVKVYAGLAVDIAMFERHKAVELIRKNVQGQLEKINSGIIIERIDLEGISPPFFVKRDFEEVIRAGQERGRKINEALGYYSKTLEQARGVATSVLEDARIYSNRTIEEARADASYFKSLFSQYKENPKIVKNFLWQSTIKRVLAKTEDKYIIKRTSPSDQIRILIGRESR